MSLLKSHNITDKQKYKCALGSIVSPQGWKGKVWSIEEVIAIRTEASAKGWDSLVDELVEHQTEDCVSPISDDIALAEYYILKVKSSKKRGIPFELTLSEFKQLLKKKRCHYTREVLIHQPNQRNTYTLDRIDNKLGYTKANTVPCARWVNQMKNELFENPLSEFLTDMKTLLKVLGKISEKSI